MDIGHPRCRQPEEDMKGNFVIGIGTVIGADVSGRMRYWYLVHVRFQGRSKARHRYRHVQHP
jgi:hypothetical protein